MSSAVGLLGNSHVAHWTARTNATNAEAKAQKTGTSGRRLLVHGLSASLSGGTGNVRIDLTRDDSTVLGSWYIDASLSRTFSIVFAAPIVLPDGESAECVLPAGGSTIVGEATLWGSDTKAF